MKIIGLTGGIGSGKTTVAAMFSELGIPVYNADIEAKKLTDSSEEIRQELTALLGSGIYKEDVLDRKLMASLIFNDAELLQKTNAIIHPRVAEHFRNWVSVQQAPYIIKEAAILFESGTAAGCDRIILVTAPREKRIGWVMERDQATREEVLARMKNQWSDAQKEKLSDYIIHNTDLSDTKKQVEELHLLLKQQQ